MAPPEGFVDEEVHGSEVDGAEQDRLGDQFDPGLGLELEPVQDEGNDEVAELQEELGR